jgi:hypothetical protein
MEYTKPISPTVLLFEPDERTHALVRLSLALFDANLETAPDEAGFVLRLARFPKPDLLIADVRLVTTIPNLLPELRALGFRVPVILLGGGTTQLWDLSAWIPGQVEVRIGTPISADSLIWAIRRALEGASES